MMCDEEEEWMKRLKVVQQLQLRMLPDHH